MQLDAEFIMVTVLQGRLWNKRRNVAIMISHLDGHPDVHLDVQCIVVIVLGLSLNETASFCPSPISDGCIALYY